MSRKTRRSRRGRVLVLVILVLAAGALVLWTRSGDTTPAATGSTAAPTTAGAPASDAASSDSLATDPETADGSDGDETAGEESGEIPPEVAAPSSSTAAPENEEPAVPAPVTVLLTYSGYDPSTSAVVAGGYAADVAEVDATCTLVLRRSGVELRGESLGTPSATTTDCGEVRVGGDALTPGTWEAVLGYTSEQSAGESAPVEVVVP